MQNINSFGREIHPSDYLIYEYLRRNKSVKIYSPEFVNFVNDFRFCYDVFKFKNENIFDMIIELSEYIGENRKT